MIRDLFFGERTAMLLSPEERLEHRRRVAGPLMKRLRAWVDEQRTCDHVIKRSKSPFAKALTYLHNQWASLERFLEHPEIPVHNNRSELLLRGPVTGRKAWLFAGSPDGADAAAIEFSLVASCMLQGVDPAVYLDDVMPSLGRKTPAEVVELTPAKWAHRFRDRHRAAD